MSATVELIYDGSSGCHRAAAVALRDAIVERGLSWDVRIVCIQDLLAPGASRLFHRSRVHALSGYWSERRPDLVVSLLPHFSRALQESLDRTHPGSPLVTILTEIADYPPRFWMERREQYLICGSERAVRRAHAIGLSARKVFPVSGMIVHPRFYRQPRPDRILQRMRVGLRPDLPTGLVRFGREGSLEMVEIARSLNRPGSGVQLILLCGRHERAQNELLSVPQAIPMLVEGFTRDTPFYMDLADFFIGKPGSSSLNEAIVKRLPIIVRRDRRAPSHERGHCEWIQEQELGLVVNRTGGMLDAVRELLRPERFSRFRQKLAAMRNTAVFEIPALLEGILRQQPQASRPGFTKPRTGGQRDIAGV